jgi:tRNA (guanine37-N1)-methyltransferase
MTQRIDLFTIFPAYFDALDLSLAGKARDRGLLDVRVHDLRDWTHDRHRTVDDTPYGGGAGMVMKPEPWGEALDSVDVGPTGAILVVPTPAGERFTQAKARELATCEHLVFACGRYEGIDQRVADHAASRFEVLEVSLGDYVLNGGEVAALAICEAVVRLLPGFMGNAESVVGESHEDGLLEAPVYTKPPTWRGLDVPPVLLSGDHGAIARWRHEQSRRRTAELRPDLLSPSVLLEDVLLRRVEPADAGELFTLQRACWLQEEQANPGVPIPALEESLDDVRAWIREGTVLVARSQGRLVGAVRAVLRDGVWHIGRLMVAPDLQGNGLGRLLLEAVELAAPPEATSYALFTGAGSKRNQKMYKRAGYRLAGSPSPGVVSMVKSRSSVPTSAPGAAGRSLGRSLGPISDGT